MGRESFPERDTLHFHSFFNFDLFRFKTESNITVRIYICFNTDRKKRENHNLNLQTIHTTSIGFYFSFPIKTEISFIGFVSRFKFFFNLTQKLKALHFCITWENEIFSCVMSDELSNQAFPLKTRRK